MSKKAKDLKFEQALGQLEKMVQKLEEGDLTLEESLKVFEEGMSLSQLCEKQLGEAEEKVEMLLKDKSGKKVAKRVNKNVGLEEEI